MNGVDHGFILRSENMHTRHVQGQPRKTTMGPPHHQHIRRSNIAFNPIRFPSLQRGPEWRLFETKLQPIRVVGLAHFCDVERLPLA